MNLFGIFITCKKINEINIILKKPEVEDLCIKLASNIDCLIIRLWLLVLHYHVRKYPRLPWVVIVGIRLATRQFQFTKNHFKSGQNHFYKDSTISVVSLLMVNFYRPCSFFNTWSNIWEKKLILKFYFTLLSHY